MSENKLSPWAEEEIERAKARMLVRFNERRRDVLPRRIYKLAGAPVPEQATDEYQIIDDPNWEPPPRKRTLKQWWRQEVLMIPPGLYGD